MFLCLVLRSNFSHSLSRLRAYSYSTSPRRLKNSWNSPSRDSFDSMRKSRQPSWSLIWRRISAAHETEAPSHTLTHPHLLPPGPTLLHTPRAYYAAASTRWLADQGRAIHDPRGARHHDYCQFSPTSSRLTFELRVEIHRPLSSHGPLFLSLLLSTPTG